MPRKKKVKSEDIKGFQEEDESLIVHLPIKVKQESSSESKEFKKLQDENKELKEKINLLIAENLSKVKVIKNTNNLKNNSTVSKCWWCNAECCQSIILPDKKKKDKFYGLGVFCSYNCAMAYNFEINDEKVWERCSLLYQLRETIEKNKILDKINPAPPKEVLKEFGGELSRDEYKNILSSVNYSYIKLYHPMVSSTIFIEQRNKSTQNLSQMNLLGLKLKRNKNPVKNKFSLENLIQL